jgi:hypothetical protein
MPGADGADGAPGVNGQGAAWAGNRLSPVCIHGEDGSGFCDGRFLDNARNEICWFQLTGIVENYSERCLPAMRDSTGFGGWTTSDCQGIPAGVETLGPNGMSALVRLTTDGSLWEQAGATVPQVYVKQGGLCVLWNNLASETLYIYTQVAPTEFVRGEIY